MTKTEEKKKKETTRKCFLCDNKILAPASDYWCYGCEEYICGGHNGNTKFGKHKPEDHLDEEEN